MLCAVMHLYDVNMQGQILEDRQSFAMLQGLLCKVQGSLVCSLAPLHDNFMTKTG